MREDQVKLVQQTFAQVKPIAEIAAGLFYQRLFELDPSLRTMFKTNIAQQGERLMNAIEYAVSNLANSAQLRPALAEMGQRHASYGVREEHYQTVAEALLWTLKRGLGKAFTSEVSQAWEHAYATLSKMMQSGAGEVHYAEREYQPERRVSQR